MSISRLTRSRLFDVLIADEIIWHGRLSSVDFLDPIFNIRALPSTDARFETAYFDIEKHVDQHNDWPENWVYSDDRIGLLSCPDEQFLAFLCRMVSPGVRESNEEVQHLVDLFNDALSSEGWSIVEDSKVGKHSFYTSRPVADVWSATAVASTGQHVLLPSGFHHLADPFFEFQKDHPDPEKNVFLIMRFRDTDDFKVIHQALKNQLSWYGVHVLRADDKEYAPELWSNVCLYMLGCKYGVAVFEEIDDREANPNIALELGFMLALNRRCLILKDTRMPRMPADIIGHLYKPLDTRHIATSVREAVDKWASDLGLEMQLPF